jgi:hypothetical protein
MVHKEFIFSKIKELEDTPKGVLFVKNNNIYFDCLNLTLLTKEAVRGYGVSAALASKFNAFYGRTGEEAKKALKKILSLSNGEIQTFFNISVLISIREVSARIGEGIFEGLPDAVQAVLVSLWRQFGRFGGFESPALTMAAKMLTRGHIKSAIHYLKDERGWSTSGREFMHRRLKEAAILETSTAEGK